MRTRIKTKILLKTNKIISIVLNYFTYLHPQQNTSPLIKNLKKVEKKYCKRSEFHIQNIWKHNHNIPISKHQSKNKSDSKPKKKTSTQAST